MKVSTFILILFLSCISESGRKTVHKQTVSATSVNPYRELSRSEGTERIKVTYDVINATGNTYGYNIYIGGRLFIHQPHRPALQGKQGFVSKADAEKVAQQVILKIQKGEVPPSISIEEMKQLDIIN